MTVKNAKAATFALMAAAVAVSLYGSQYALADDVALAERIEKYEQKIERLAEEAVQSGNVTTSEILERLGDRWIEKYDDAEHFETSERAIHAYINRNLDADGLNSQNALHHLKIQNFETITGSVGDGHEITLLVAEHEKLRGIYEPSDPVRRYHEWIALQYETPESQKEIQARLVKLIGDEKFLDLAFGHAENFDGLAENGSVPVELFDSDINFWIFTSNVSVCSYEQDCDVEVLRHAPQTDTQDIEELERLLGFKPVSFNPWDYILPQAYAEWERVYVNYMLFGYVSATECYYGNCYQNWYDGSNNGSSEIDVVDFFVIGEYASGLEHAARNAEMIFYGSACEMHDGSQYVVNSVEVTPYLAQALRPDLAEENQSTGPCAVAVVADVATHPWILGINIRSDGSYYWANNNN